MSIKIPTKIYLTYFDFFLLVNRLMDSGIEASANEENFMDRGNFEKWFFRILSLGARRLIFIESCSSANFFFFVSTLGEKNCYKCSFHSHKIKKFNFLEVYFNFFYSNRYIYCFGIAGNFGLR